MVMTSAAIEFLYSSKVSVAVLADYNVRAAAPLSPEWMGGPRLTRNRMRQRKLVPEPHGGSDLCPTTNILTLGGFYREASLEFVGGVGGLVGSDCDDHRNDRDRRRRDCRDRWHHELGEDLERRRRGNSSHGPNSSAVKA